MPIFESRVELNHPVEEVFRWHTRPHAFDRLTPPWEHVEVRRREGGIQAGGRATLILRKGPASLTWEVEHTEYEENRSFVDVQVSGPFRRWRHEHRFEELEGGRTAVVDRVEWEAPLGSLGETFGGGYIENALRRMFAFRGRRLQGDLALHARYTTPRPLRVAVTGSTGLIGSTLTAFLRSGGHEVLRITRGGGGGGVGELRWDPARGEIDGKGLEGVDGVVHLAGESIAGVRWTAAKKEEILRSRVEGTKLLARTLGELSHPPKVLISASGMNFYGNRGDEPVTEDSDGGKGFLADVTRQWEGATHLARARGIRTVYLRSGMVLSPAGGVLGTILLPFQMGLGGRLGSGRQFTSWIDLDDEVAVILHALVTSELRGPVNATAPHPVPNSAFTDILGRVLGRPTILPVPSLAIRLALGEMGEELLLSGARVLPERLRATGYEFLYPELEGSLRHQLGREEEEG